MALLDRGLRRIEHPRLAEVVGKAVRPDPALFGGRLCEPGDRDKALIRRPRPCVLARFGKAVRLVIRAALRDHRLHHPVPLEIVHRALRCVDRDLVKVRGAQPRFLGVEVGKEPPLQQRVVRKVDSRHDVGGQEGHLLGFRKEVVRPAVQHHPPDDAHGHILFGDQLGGVQNVIGLRVGKGVVKHLDAQVPFREVPDLDRVVQVAAVIVRVGAGNLHRLVPQGRLHPKARAPVELDEGRRALGIHQPEGVDAKTLHHPQAARQGAVRHRPHDHVHRFRHQRDEIPERVMRRGRLRKAAVGLGFYGVDKVGELHRVLDEEDRDVVADKVPVAFAGIELDREPAHVAGRVLGPFRPRHGREPGKDRHFRALVLEQRGAGQLGDRLGAFERAMRPGAPGMDDPFGDPLVVKVEDLFAQHKVFQKRRPPRPRLQRVLVVRHRNAVVRGQHLTAALLRLAA